MKDFQFLAVKGFSVRLVYMNDMSKTEFDLRMSRGHVLFDGGAGLLLVDTGSPWSFHESGRIRLCGEESPIPTSLPDADSAYVSENVGEPVSGNTFETPIFELPASFAGQAFTLRAGHLPDGIQMMVSVLGADAVVGLEILGRFPVAVVGGRVWV